MIDKEQIIQVVYKAIDEVNLQLPKDQWIIKRPETILFDPPNNLDSLTILNLIVETEQQIEKEFGIMILLTGDDLLNRNTTPLASIGKLTDHIYTLL